MHSKNFQPNLMPGVLQRFERNISASPNTTSLGMIIHVHPESIEFSARIRGLSGMIMVLAIIVAAIGFWSANSVLSFEMKKTSLTLVSLIAYPFVIGVSSYSIYFLIKCMRIELFRPKDEPTIFDRRNRKIYRIYREIDPGALGIFKRWPLKMVEHDWHLTYAEHHAITNANTASISRMHSLIFKVQKSVSDATIIDSFGIGSSIQMGEMTVPAVWEHIRRFMEENGPHLPPGEAIEDRLEPHTLLECMAATGPYGTNFRRWWCDHTAMMVVGLMFFPITFPIMTFLGLFSWLAIKTARPVVWSPHVLNAIR